MIMCRGEEKVFMDSDKFAGLVKDSIDKYEKAFMNVVKDNPPGKLRVYRINTYTMEVRSEGQGTFKFYMDKD